MEQEQQLLEILDTMDLPQLRKDATNVHHLRWLERNIMVRNSQNPRFNEAMELVRALIRKYSDVA